MRTLSVLATLVALVTSMFGAMSPLGAATRIIEPSPAFTVALDASGKPEQFTVKANGFQPNDQVVIVQCDGVPATDPKWQPTGDCDTSTSPAAASADAKGVVVFPANDVNFGLQPFIGSSPQRLFNCLAPGQAEPKNGLKSYTNCQVRVATDVTHATSDQAFVTFRFPGEQTKSSSSSNTWLIVIAGLVGVLFVATLIILVRRRARAV